METSADGTLRLEAKLDFTSSNDLPPRSSKSSSNAMTTEGEAPLRTGCSAKHSPSQRGSLVPGKCIRHWTALKNGAPLENIGNPLSITSVRVLFNLRQY